MEAYEKQLSGLLQEGDLVAASAFIANAKGETLYSHYAGHQSLEPGAPAIDSSNTLALYSAGKFITHLAVLQLVEQGLAGLDDPVYDILPELKDLHVITAAAPAAPAAPAATDGSSAGGEKFKLIPRKKDMTLRHILSNSSGIPSDDGPLVRAWAESGGSYSFPDDTPKIIQLFARPLLFEPGEGWCYGHDVHLLQVVVERLSGLGFVRYVEERIFAALDLRGSCYLAGDQKAQRQVYQKRIHAMERDNSTGAVETCADDVAYGCTMSAADIQTLLVDLISPAPRLLKTKEGTYAMFGPSLSGTALEAFRREASEFAGAPAGILPKGQACDSVSYTCGGAMVVEREAGLASPEGSLVWDGMLNVAWAANREKGVCMFWGTQLLPEYDEKTLGLMRVFFETAWARYG